MAICHQLGREQRRVDKEECTNNTLMAMPLVSFIVLGVLMNEFHSRKMESRKPKAMTFLCWLQQQ
jgi:hypothetical protein